MFKKILKHTRALATIALLASSVSSSAFAEELIVSDNEMQKGQAYLSSMAKRIHEAVSSDAFTEYNHKRMIAWVSGKPQYELTMVTFSTDSLDYAMGYYFNTRNASNWDPMSSKPSMLVVEFATPPVGATYTVPRFMQGKKIVLVMKHSAFGSASIPANLSEREVQCYTDLPQGTTPSYYGETAGVSYANLMLTTSTVEESGMKYIVNCKQATFGGTALNNFNANELGTATRVIQDAGSKSATITLVP